MNLFNNKVLYKDFSSFLNDVNPSVNNARNNAYTGNSTGRLRLSKAEIKFIGKQVSIYIKNKQYISATEFQKLASLRRVIENQHSRCTAEKLRNFDRHLRRSEHIKSSASLASEAMEKNFQTLADAQAILSKIQPPFRASMNKLNEKIMKIDIANTPITEKQKEACIKAPMPTKYYKLRSIMFSLKRVEEKVQIDIGRWGRKQEMTQKNVTYLQGFKEWSDCKKDARSLYSDALRMKKITRPALRALEANKKISCAFQVPNNMEGVKRLKEMK